LTRATAEADQPPGGDATTGTASGILAATPTTNPAPSTTVLDMGEIAPRFNAVALSGNPTYAFDSAAGRPIVLLFMGSSNWTPSRAALALADRNADIFDDDRAAFFGVTIDPNDVAQGRIAQRIPGIRWFLDYDRKVSRLYHAIRGEGSAANYVPFWLLLDSTMRVIKRAPIDKGESIFAALNAMVEAGAEQASAPVLTVPRVFEPELCRELIRIYDADGGHDSGFMRTRDGKTVSVIDHSFKRRSDCEIADPMLRGMLLDRMRRRLVPQIVKAFNYHPTRIERWMVCCYDADGGGFFRPHRDNTTAGTAHRVFACTINLNAEAFDGGDLRFPEYGLRTYRAPTGGAVIFSCALLHEAMPVTRGRRYAFVPFFYDEEKARLRERNQIHFADGRNTYRAGSAELPAEPGAHSRQP